MSQVPGNLRLARFVTYDERGGREDRWWHNSTDTLASLESPDSAGESSGKDEAGNSEPGLEEKEKKT